MKKSILLLAVVGVMFSSANLMAAVATPTTTKQTIRSGPVKMIKKSAAPTKKAAESNAN